MGYDHSRFPLSNCQSGPPWARCRELSTSGLPQTVKCYPWESARSFHQTLWPSHCALLLKCHPGPKGGGAPHISVLGACIQNTLKPTFHPSVQLGGPDPHLSCPRSHPEGPAPLPAGPSHRGLNCLCVNYPFYFISLWVFGFVLFLLVVLALFETGFPCVDLTVLELALLARPASNSQMPLPP